MNTPLYLYIHGFNSSPQSYKARQMMQWMTASGRGERFLVPELPYQPAQAVALLEQQLNDCLQGDTSPCSIILLGSSLGGFYATYLTEKLSQRLGTECDLRTVLINPAIRPFDLLDVWLGENENIYTHERYLLTSEHLAQLKALDCPTLQAPERYLLLTQSGDEVLDYRQGVEKYAQSSQVVTQGGDHGFQGFESYWPQIFEFAGDNPLQKLAECYLRDNPQLLMNHC